MNQIREWNGHCQRCLEKCDIYTMSIFDVSLICMKCNKIDKGDSRYKRMMGDRKKDDSGS